MFTNTELNLLPIESVYETDDFIYGALSKTSALHLLFAELELPNNEELGRLNFNSVAVVKTDLFNCDLQHQQMPAEALLEFVNLQDRNTQQVVDYVRRYGLYSLLDLGIEESEKIHNYPKKIQSYWKDSYEKGLLPFARSLDNLWRYKRMVTRWLMMAKVIREADETGVKSFYFSLGFPNEIQENATVNSYEGSWLRLAKHELSKKLKIALEGVVLGLKDERGRLVPTLASYGFADALAMLIFDYIYRGIPLGECQNPECKKLFFITRATKKFCSGRCQALIKVHRFRNKPREDKGAKSSQKSVKRKGGK